MIVDSDVTKKGLMTTLTLTVMSPALRSSRGPVPVPSALPGLEIEFPTLPLFVVPEPAGTLLLSCSAATALVEPVVTMTGLFSACPAAFAPEELGSGQIQYVKTA